METAEERAIAQMFDFTSAKNHREGLVVWARGERFRATLHDKLQSNLAMIMFAIGVEVQVANANVDDAILAAEMHNRFQAELDYLTGPDAPVEARLDAAKYSMTGNSAFAQAAKTLVLHVKLGGRLNHNNCTSVSACKKWNGEQSKAKEKAKEIRELEAAVDRELVKSGLEIGTEEFEEARAKRLIVLQGGKDDTASEPVIAASDVPAFIIAEANHLVSVMNQMLASGIDQATIKQMVSAQISSWEGSIKLIGKGSGFLKAGNQ